MTRTRRGDLPGASLVLFVVAAAAGWIGSAVASPAAGVLARAAPSEGARLVASQDVFDDPATTAMVERASALWRNPPPVAYKARAQGRIYFYLDRDDGGEPVPLRVDQVAVDAYRDKEGRTRQTIRAQRRKELLPVRDFEYYLDRLTVVQDGYSEEIEIGQGLDVRGVPHPLARGAAAIYRYRLADSVTVQLPLADGPVRVYEIVVQPRREDQPGLVGSLFLEGETGALARMEFGFTAASYVDPRSDYVRVVLEHALWDVGYWLPYRQQIEVRREQPSVDLPFGSVIRTNLQVASYDFEPSLAPDFFLGPAVSFASPGAGSAEFDGGLMDEMAEEGLSPVSLARLESEARRVARARLAGRLPKLRLHADRFSSVLRANRAEGLHLGGGASFLPSPRWPDLKLLAGVSGLAGRGGRRLSATLRGERRMGRFKAGAEAYVRQLRDLGPRPGVPGVVNTVAALFGRDFTDPYFAHGVRAVVELELGNASRGRLAVLREKHEAAGQALLEASLGGRAFRPVRAAEEGVFAGAEAEIARSWGGRGAWGFRSELRATTGRWKGNDIGELQVRLAARVADKEMSRQAAARIDAGTVWGAVPVQRLYFLGGAGTLPGRPFREHAGKRFLLANVEATAAVVPGWLSVRLIAGTGTVAGAHASAGPAESTSGRWNLRPSRGLLGYAGAGIGLLRDVVRADFAWGAPGGRFEFVVSASPAIAIFL